MNLLAAVPALLVSLSAGASTLPPNNLHLQDRVNRIANITEAQFNEIIDPIIARWAPMAQAHGGQLKAVKNWNSSTVNASAMQPLLFGNTWKVNMYGGLARRPEITKDAFALVVCHELGHHFGGFVLKGNTWAANEGQADYFATQVCAREIWQSQRDVNAEYRDQVPAAAKEACDHAWSTAEEQDLCYRTTVAGQSLANLLAALGTQAEPLFETPDESQVSSTNHEHPAAQCRLDTYLAGATCDKAFDLNKIPGRKHAAGQSSTAAEREAYNYSCATADGYTSAFRPRCWFKPAL
jgi:hypothetical protein